MVKVGRMKPGEVEGMVQTRRRAVVEKMEVLVGPGVRGEREIWAERWLWYFCFLDVEKSG